MFLFSPWLLIAVFYISPQADDYGLGAFLGRLYQDGLLIRSPFLSMGRGIEDNQEGFTLTLFVCLETLCSTENIKQASLFCVRI